MTAIYSLPMELKKKVVDEAERMVQQGVAREEIDRFVRSSLDL